MGRLLNLICLLILASPGAAAAADGAPGEEPEASVAEAAQPDEPVGPWLWIKPSVAVQYAPLGLIGDLRVQARAPLHRSDSIVFQNTYAGVGGRLAITPAFVDVGPRFSFAPLDIFDVDVQLGYVAVWPSSSGLLPFHALEGTLDSQRKQIADTAVGGHALYASVIPTFKLKLGPVIAFTQADFSFIHVFQPETVASPYVYEAYRNTLIAWDDVVLTSQTGLLGEILDGEATAVQLRAGALLRHRQAFVSGHVSTALGGVVTLRPGRKEGWPTVLLAVLGYLREADRALGAPNIQLRLSWDFERPLPLGPK